jgi:hypothetical protein
MRVDDLQDAGTDRNDSSDKKFGGAESFALPPAS